jgi:hypothetical protein
MKRGNLIKLKYEFDDSKACFVQLRSGTWVQATPKDFRSYDGPRKLLYSKYLGPEDNLRMEEIYEGPVYGHGTNFIMEEIPKNTHMLLYYITHPKLEAQPTMSEEMRNFKL